MVAEMHHPLGQPSVVVCMQCNLQVVTSLNTLENLTAVIPAALVAGVASDLASSAARCAGRVRSRSHES